MGNSKYNAQMKHIKKNYKKFHIDFKLDTFNKLQEVCKKNNTTPTSIIKEFINDYINKNSWQYTGVYDILF